MHRFLDDCRQLCFGQVGVGGLRLFGGQFQDVGAHRFLDETGEVPLASTPLAGEEEAKRLVGVGLHGDVPAYSGGHGSFLEMRHCERREAIQNAGGFWDSGPPPAPAGFTPFRALAMTESKQQTVRC